MRPSPSATPLLAAVLAVAFALRLWNLGFGLPAWYHPDEPIKAREVLRMAGGDLAPERFYHPTFLLYAGAVSLRIGHLFGLPLDEASAALAGRFNSALLGTFTVLLTFLLGRRLSGSSGGLAAASLLAVSPLHVACSHYLKEDVAMTFWAVAVALCTVRFLESGTRRHLVAGGFLAGVCAGTKYTGVLFVALPLAQLVCRNRRDRGAGRSLLKNGGRGGSSLAVVAWWAATGFLLTTPYALIALPRFLVGLGHSGARALSGHAEIAVWPWGYLWTYHLRFSLVPGLGMPAVALALAGTLLALWRGGPPVRAIALATIALYALLESSPYKPPPNADRYTVVLLPFCCALAAFAVHRFAEVSRRRAAAWLVIVAAAAWPAARAGSVVREMPRDTREAARVWLERHVCGRAPVVLEGALFDGRRMVPSYVPELPESCGATYVYSLARERPPLEPGTVVVASSFMYGRYFELRGAPRAAREFYERLFASTEPLMDFASPTGPYGFHNPVLRVRRAR